MESLKLVLPRLLGIRQCFVSLKLEFTKFKSNDFLLAIQTQGLQVWLFPSEPHTNMDDTNSILTLKKAAPYFLSFISSEYSRLSPKFTEI